MDRGREITIERANGVAAGGGKRAGRREADRERERTRGRNMAILRLGKIDVQMRHHVITSTSKRERYLAV